MNELLELAASDGVFVSARAGQDDVVALRGDRVDGGGDIAGDLALDLRLERSGIAGGCLDGVDVLGEVLALDSRTKTRGEAAPEARDSIDEEQRDRVRRALRHGKADRRGHDGVGASRRRHEDSDALRIE